MELAMQVEGYQIRLENLISALASLPLIKNCFVRLKVGFGNLQSYIEFPS